MNFYRTKMMFVVVVTVVDRVTTTNVFVSVRAAGRFVTFHVTMLLGTDSSPAEFLAVTTKYHVPALVMVTCVFVCAPLTSLMWVYAVADCPKYKRYAMIFVSGDGRQPNPKTSASEAVPVIADRDNTRVSILESVFILF